MGGGTPGGYRSELVLTLPQPLPTEPHGPGRYDRYVSLRFSVNLDRHSHGNLTNYSSRVPVCQADAPVAGRTTDRIRAVGTMNADAPFVQTNPDDPNRITWTRWDSIKVAASPVSSEIICEYEAVAVN